MPDEEEPTKRPGSLHMRVPAGSAPSAAWASTSRQEIAASSAGASSGAVEEEAYNSEDEYDSHVQGGPEQERAFEAQMAQRGLEIRQMAKDGNCLFRCIADRVYGDADMHDVARRLCTDHMQKERDHFSQYVTQDFDAYLRRKRRDGTFGNHIEMQALSEIYSRPIEVYALSATPVNTFQSAEGSGSDVTPLRVSYHGRNHYNVGAAPLPLHTTHPLSPPSHPRTTLAPLPPLAPHHTPHTLTPCHTLHLSHRFHTLTHAHTPSHSLTPRPCAPSPPQVLVDPAHPDVGVGLGLPGLH